jgi:Bacteriophage related domain of unknown function
MSASQIGAALKARLETLVFSPEAPIAWPNRDFTPCADRYLAVQIVRAPNQRLTIKGASRLSGTFVVTVASRTNAGSGQGEGIADAVASHFTVDTIMPLATGRLRVTAEPSIRDGFLEGGYWRTPVFIPFEVLR